jgi:Family of unknown function (DUF6460)
MIDEKIAPPPLSQAWQTKTPEPAPLRRPETALTRFLGGTPAGVATKLVFLSLIVGALLMWLDVRPVDIFNWAQWVVHRIWGLGFDAVRLAGDYLLAGAIIVVPLWLAYRLLAMRGPR